MKFSEVKNIVEFCKDIDFEKDDFAEVIENIDQEEQDFEVNDYRFIHTDYIDDILADELKNDTWLLGCFNDWFIASITGLPIKMINAVQEAECYEELGEVMLDHIDEVVEEYVKADGYGHHFSPYDGKSLELGEYLVFRLN